MAATIYRMNVAQQRAGEAADELEAERARLATAVSGLTAQLAAERERLSISEAGSRSLTEALATKSSALADALSATAKLAAASGQLEQERMKVASLEAQLLSAQRESQVLYQSLSWRVTGPLRHALKQWRGY